MKVYLTAEEIENARKFIFEARNVQRFTIQKQVNYMQLRNGVEGKAIKQASRDAINEYVEEVRK